MKTSHIIPNSHRRRTTIWRKRKFMNLHSLAIRFQLEPIAYTTRALSSLRGRSRECRVRKRTVAREENPRRAGKVPSIEINGKLREVHRSRSEWFFFSLCGRAVFFFLEALPTTYIQQKTSLLEIAVARASAKLNILLSSSRSIESSFKSSPALEVSGKLKKSCRG